MIVDHLVLTAPKKRPIAWQPTTLGEHLRHKRLTLGLSQTQVAAQIGANLSAYNYWELDKATPTMAKWRDIIGFLGYDPIGSVPESLPELIVTVRRRLGLSRPQLGARLGVDKATIANWEHGRFPPRKKTMRALLTQMLSG